jgi:hypothetical protein
MNKIEENKPIKIYVVSYLGEVCEIVTDKPADVHWVDYDETEGDLVHKINHKPDPERARLLNDGAPLEVTCGHHLRVQGMIERGILPQP